MLIAIYILSTISLFCAIGIIGITVYNIRLKPKYKMQQRLAFMELKIILQLNYQEKAYQELDRLEFKQNWKK